MAASAEELKASLKDLSQRRSQIEQEIAVRSARLEAAGVGLKGSLVDKEGYPRADIDIPAIRADRHAVIALSNDHKTLSSKLEQLLHQLHAQSRNPGNAQQTSSTAAPIAAANGAPVTRDHPSAAATGQEAQQAVVGADSQPPQLRPFAVVDEVSPASPASRAGIQLGDQLARFGDVTAEAPGTLQQVAAVLQAHEGHEVEAVFLRHGATVTLKLVPQRWSGRGLLGCHLRPL
ncbi:hypothetical protein N2152v2_003623 [Parachlorella kessleri]